MLFNISHIYIWSFDLFSLHFSLFSNTFIKFTVRHTMKSLYICLSIFNISHLVIRVSLSWWKFSSLNFRYLIFGPPTFPHFLAHRARLVAGFMGCIFLVHIWSIDLSNILCSYIKPPYGKKYLVLRSSKITYLPYF